MGTFVCESICEDRRVDEFADSDDVAGVARCAAEGCPSSKAEFLFGVFARR